MAFDAFETAAAESLQGNHEPSPECRSHKTPAERKPQLDGSPLSAESMFCEIMVSETGAAPSSPATVSPLVPQTRVDPEVPLTNKDLDAKKTTVEPEVPLSNKDLVAKNGGHQKPDQENKVAKGGLASSGSMEFYATESEAGHDDEPEKPTPRKGMKRPAAAQPEKTDKKPAASLRDLKRPAAAVSKEKEKEAAESEAGLMPPAAEEVTATPEKRRKFVVMQVSSGRLLRQPRLPRFPQKSNQSALGLGLMWRDSSTARRLFAEIGRPDVPNSRSFAISM